MTDVIEHLQHDEMAIKNTFDLLQEGGWLLLTVPAFKMLWGSQDILAHHLRRYQKKDIKNLVERNHFKIKRIFYFNFFLFFPIFLVRKILMQAGEIKNENTINNKWINKILLMLFYFDCWLALLMPFPFGVSICVVAQKPPTQKT
jgi:predicted SAM-dependent methyltransferase